MELNIQDIYDNENVEDVGVIDEQVGFIENQPSKFQGRQQQQIQQMQQMQQTQHQERMQQIQQQRMKQIQQQKNENNKKLITYDNILSSLNMKVVNGKLQIVRNDGEEPVKQKKTVAFNPQTQIQSIPNRQQQQQMQQMQQQQMQQQQMQQQQMQQQQMQQQQMQQQQMQQMQQYQMQQQMGPQIIYDENGGEPQAIYIPMTKEEYKRRLAIQQLRKIQARIQMEKIKPRKMKFV
jgi:hypothetical protein